MHSHAVLWCLPFIHKQCYMYNIKLFGQWRSQDLDSGGTQVTTLNLPALIRLSAYAVKSVGSKWLVCMNSVNDIIWWWPLIRKWKINPYQCPCLCTSPSKIIPLYTTEPISYHIWASPKERKWNFFASSLSFFHHRLCSNFSAIFLCFLAPSSGRNLVSL